MMTTKQKTIFRNKKIKVMKQMISHSNEEMKRYKKRHAIIHLRQSCEKMYNAYLYLVEALTYEEVRSHKRAAHLVLTKIKDKDVTELAMYAEIAHEFFYEGESTSIWVCMRMQRAHEYMKKIIKKKGLYVKNV